MKNIHIFLLIVAFFVVLAGYVFYTNSLNRDQETVSKPLQVSLGSQVNARLFELENDQLTDVTFIPEGSIVSRSRRNDINVVASIIMPENEIGNLLILEDENGGKQLDDPSSIKDAVTISPNGSYIAYAELNLVFGTTLYSEEVSDWNVMLLNVATGEIQDLGVGFRPQFLTGDANVVIYSTPEGIAGFDIDSGQMFVVLSELAVTNTTRAAHVSPDGAYLSVYNTITGRYNIFTITQTSPLELSGFGEMPVAVDVFALTNEYAYGVVRNQETNEHTLWRYVIADLSLPFAEGELLYTFLPEELPYQIIP